MCDPGLATSVINADGFGRAHACCVSEIGWGGYKNKQYLRNRFYFIQFSADGPRHHSQHVDCVSADGPIAVSRFDLVSFCC